MAKHGSISIPKKVMNLKGKRFGLLYVSGYAGAQNARHYWHCKCDCGKSRSIRADALRCGGVGSCGCVKLESKKRYEPNPNVVEQKCIVCKATKPVAEFDLNKRVRSGLSGRCKECRRQYMREYIEVNYDHCRQRDRITKNKRRKITGFNERLKANYGIDERQYNQILDSQGGVCGICGSPPIRNKKNGRSMLGVDHDHKTGKVRGIICQFCNIGLGGFRDNTATMLRAIGYLQRSRKES